MRVKIQIPPRVFLTHDDPIKWLKEQGVLPPYRSFELAPDNMGHRRLVEGDLNPCLDLSECADA